MGNCFYRTLERESDGEQKKTFLGPREAFLIPPGQFAYLLTKEEISVPPDAMAFISMKTGIKLQGLINVSGFHVDPGYSGRLIFAVHNASPSPIQVCEGDPLFKIWFADLDRESGKSFIFGKKGHIDISGDLIKGMNREILSLQSLSEKIRRPEGDVLEKFAEQKPVIDNLTFVWRAIIIGVILALLALASPAVLRVGGEVSQWLSGPDEAATPPAASIPSTGG